MPRHSLNDLGDFLARVHVWGRRTAVGRWLNQRERETILRTRVPLPTRNLEITPQLDADSLDWRGIPTADLAAALPPILEHRFDILGSGPVQANQSLDEAGPQAGTERRPVWWDEERETLLCRRERALQKGISAEYAPIDWSRDLVSGARWPDILWFREARAITPPGADIKVPWELGRLQHLVTLACGFAAGKQQNADAPLAARYLREFQDQVLDFLQRNPPGFSVSWACPMDVAIRVANLLVAYDIIHQAGANFSTTFRRAVGTAAHDHGAHIFSNLERTGSRRNNHYLTNLVGLVFVGRYLPDDPAAQHWYRFAVNALQQEQAHQFFPAGPSREGSTFYHRFCTEMVLWATILIQGGPAPAPQLSAQLPGMVAFLRDLTRPDGQLVSIGDMDSGFFLEPVPPLQRDGHVPRQDKGRIDHVLDLLAALDPEQELNTASATMVLARGFRSLRSTRLSVMPKEVCPSGVTPSPPLVHNGEVSRLEFPVGIPDLRAGLTSVAHSDFGVYIFRSDHLHLTVRCGTVPTQWSHPNGHFHMDQLTLTVHYRGRDVIADPGTFVYTRDARLRNLYRAQGSHFGLLIPEDIEQRTLAGGLFILTDPPQGVCEKWSPYSFRGRLEWRGTVWGGLEIRLERDKIIVTSRGLPLGLRNNLPVSHAYGERDTNRKTVHPDLWQGYTGESAQHMVLPLDW